MMENRPFNRPKRNLEAELETVRLIFQQDRGALLLAAAAILFGLFQSRAVVVSRIGALQAVYDSLLILLFLAFAAALLLLRYVRTHDSLSVGLDRLKAFVEFDGRFGVVLGAASILLGLKTWEELLHLTPTEFAILKQLMARPSQVITKAQLLDAINGALEELQADGTVQSIVDKYITAE